MKHLFTNLLAFSLVFSLFAQKAETVSVPYHHTRLPSKPLPGGMKKFYVEYMLDNLEKEYMRKDYVFYLDKMGIWGLERTENEGVKIQVEPDTLSISSFTNKSTYEDKQRFNKVVTFNRTLYYSATLPGEEGKPLVAERIDDHAYIKHGEWQSSEGSAENWYRSNVNLLAHEYDQEITKKNVNKLSSELSDNIGYPQIKGTVPILRIKKFRKHTYPELDQAADIAKAAFALHRIDQMYMPEICKERLQGALEIWERVISSKNMTDKKARINAEVAALAYQNLIIVRGLMDEYDKVDALYARVESDIQQYDPKGWGSYLENWKGYVNYRRERVKANN